MVAFMAALGYAIGLEIPLALGWPTWLSIVLCFAVGMGLEAVADKIVFNEAVQKKRANKIMVFAGILLIFLLAQVWLSTFSEESLFDYVLEEHGYVVILPLLGFAFHMLVRWFQIRKIRERYGDGKSGFTYEVKKEDLEEANRQNQPIQGAYDEDCAVKTKTGVYVGVKDKKYTYFSGIPYAKPPVGPLRWKAPEALPESDAVYEAKYFGASAVQVEFEGSILKLHRQSEDCLTLNVCVGNSKEDDEKKEKKPVLVLFHHGDFSYGGAADPLMYGDSFAKNNPDVVLVSFNYRLGIFGFLDFSEVPGGEGCPDALNLGLLDQIAALKWIKENIAAFGGDPQRVTVMGFEAGAGSISLLAACEKAKGLFQRAFLFFGNPEFAYDTPDAARARAKKLLELTHSATMDDLMKLSTQALKEAGQELWQYGAAPTCDGKLLPLDVFEAYRKGAASGIDFIIGIPNNERQVYKSTIGSRNYENYINVRVDGIVGMLDAENAEAVTAYIAEQAEKMPELEAKAKVFEQWNALCMYRTALKLSEGGNKVHVLFWNVKPLLENLGSGTVDVASAFFGNSEALQMYGNVLNADLSEILQSFLLKFINGEALNLYNNEIKGVDAVDWKKFPKALIISNDKLKCEPVADKLTELNSLVDFISQ